MCGTVAVSTQMPYQFRDCVFFATIAYCEFFCFESICCCFVVKVGTKVDLRGVGFFATKARIVLQQRRVLSALKNLVLLFADFW